MGAHGPESGTERLPLRRANPDDTEALGALIGAVFPDNPKRHPDVLAWQYWDNPYGPARSYVVEDAGRLVAHFAVLPLAARVDANPATIGKSVDVATLPSHQRRGLFTRTGLAAFADAADRGMVGTLCTPANPPAVAGFQRIGMVSVGHVPVFVKPLDPGWLTERFGAPAPVTRRVRPWLFTRRTPDRAERSATVPEAVDDLWAMVATRVANGMVHDARWWSWRYGARPRSDYRYAACRRGGRLVGVAVTTLVDAFGGRFRYVLDVQAVDADAANATLEAAADEPGAVGVACIALPASRLAGLLRASGFRALPRRLEPRAFNVGFVDHDPTRANLAARPWEVCWGDLDHL